MCGRLLTILIVDLVYIKRVWEHSVSYSHYKYFMTISSGLR